MSNTFDISTFHSLSNPEKINFLQDDFFELLNTIEEKNINFILRTIILDINENSYIRKKSLEVFTELVISGKLRIRHGLSLLIDDWQTTTEIFIELQRLKDLYLYYDESNEEIELIYKEKLEDSEAEIVSESLINLGLINFQKALKSLSEEDFNISLNQSRLYFLNSNEAIENRIDAIFYFKIVEILIEINNNRWGSSNVYIQALGNILFQKEVFTFNSDTESIQFSFYKMLTSLQKICNQQPNNWLDFRSELDNIYLYFSDIINLHLKQRLNQREVLYSLSKTIISKYVEPYFSIHLSSEITRINNRLKELESSSEKYQFLLSLKNIIENTDKKKVESDNLNISFKNLFPNTNSTKLNQIVNSLSTPFDYLKAFEILTEKSNSELLDSIIFACTKVQGDKNYWGGKVDENERNRYIANLIEGRRFNIKDQNQWSQSAEGKNSGEIDIFVVESDGRPKSIIEALNLDSLQSNYIITHLNKLFTYDTTGLKNNYILIYSTAKNFINLWVKYVDFISKHSYSFSFIDFAEIEDYKFTDIKIGVARHSRNDKIINLYHIMVNFNLGSAIKI